jgi:hypothetical protein
MDRPVVARKASPAVRPVVARDPPHGVRRVLEGLGHPEAAVQGAEDAHYQADRAAAEVLRLAQLLADHRELGQRRGEHLVLQSLITHQDEAEDRRGEQEQREQRNERVVGEHPSQIAAEIVEELVDHRERESRPPVSALKPVQTLRGRHTNRLTAPRQALAAHGPAVGRRVTPVLRMSYVGVTGAARLPRASGHGAGPVGNSETG